jgi:hypothetical protein
MIGCDSGYITAFLDENVAREMYPDIWVATAATATATGQATPVRGGYRVSGRFPLWSGCQHSEWVWVGRSVHQPPVIGEIIAGIVLGPSVLGRRRRSRTARCSSRFLA